jgi:hypothetical protein
MSRSKKYVTPVILFLISIGLLLWVPGDSALRTIFALPVSASLIAALFQWLKDEAQNQREKDRQQKEHLFGLGAMSHMANTVFDKHVLFCEKYMEEVHTTASALFRNGPTEEALEHAARFVAIRQEYSAWTTEDINNQLFPFEQALRSIGADGGYFRSTQGDPGYEESRRAAIKRMWQKFGEVLTVDDDVPDENIAIEEIKKKIREMLDIENLVTLRKHLIKTALDST